MSTSPKSDSSLFERLPARPPTPPRDTETDVEDALRFLRDGHQSPNTTKTAATPRVRTTTDTPPPKSIAIPQQRGSGSTKKVDFSPFPTYHKIPQLGQSSSPDTRVQRQTPLSRTTKPLKSILKAASEQLPPTPDENQLAFFSPEDPGSFCKMLYSVLRQLQSHSRDDRRDAYLAINNALKTYQDIPDPAAMVEKIDVLQQFLSRDIAWKDETGKLDNNIVTQALQLVMSLLFNSETANAIDDDFRAFLVDRCILVLEQHDVAKAILKSHVHLLAVQHFRAHIMTPARVDKLLHVFRDLEERCSGNSVIATRLIAYQRLVAQAPATMLNRMRDWIDYVFHGMLSSIGDIRTRAMECCTQAALMLGTQGQSAKIILEMFEKELEEEQTYGDFITARLDEMIKNKQMAVFVPRIWTSIILFFRCKKRPLDKWPRFRNWLLIIQRCLNNSDMEVKQHANIAWNKLVYTVMPDESTTENLRSMLKVPIVAALEKRGSDKQSQQQRQIAMDSYCNLLHYGLRPGLSYDDLDKLWDLYVEPVLSTMAKSKSRSQQQSACRIIHGLLKRSNGVWNAEAALEVKTIKPEELPRMEPRWVRSRLSRFLKVVEPIIQSGMWSSPEANKTVDVCWRLLLQNVSEAGAQEVKTSGELKDAIAQFTNLFRRIWSAESKVDRSDAEGSVWIERYQQLLQQMVDTLGAGHFVEDILAKTGEDEVEAAPTPSHRPSKHLATAHSSFVFLFALYYQPRREICAPSLYEESVVWFLQLLASKRSTAAGILTLLTRCLSFSCQTIIEAAPAEGSSRLWNAVADFAIKTLEADISSAQQSATEIKGNVLRSALDIASFGLRYAAISPACLEMAAALYTACCRAARHYGNDGAVVVGVMEPMAKSLVDIMDDVPITITLAMGETMAIHGVWPESRQELDRARKALWRLTFEMPKTPAFDGFQHFYGCVRTLFTRAYERLQQDGNAAVKGVPSFFASMSSFWQKCPKLLLPTALRQIQGGIVDWIQDHERKIFPLSGDLVLHPAPILNFWSGLLVLIKAIPQKDSALLLSIESLLVAGFSSPSKEIVNSTIDFWNTSFGEQEALVYPSRIQRVLSARRADAHIELPGFPESSDGAEIPTFPAFAESQVPSKALPDFGFMMPLVTSALKNNRLEDNIYIRQARANGGLPFTTDPPKSTASASTTPKPKPRLRHDDSQVDFAPVESSAPASVNEESQLLTEHQREVQARQKGDAQMFPEMSSSPAHSNARPKSIAKKLDFSSETGQNGPADGAVATPPGPQDNPMSDDLPSSPTPRAATIALAGLPRDEHSDDEETICDPPSSPPREDEGPATNWRTGPDDTTVVESTFNEEQEPVQPSEDPVPTSREGEVTVDGSDLPSDTLLPTAQLEREAAAAAMSHVPVTTAESTEPAGDDEHNVQPEDADTEDHTRNLQTPSRIQDSMIQEDDDATRTPEVQAETPKSSRDSRKRKRNTESVMTAKKKPKPSPIKNFLYKLIGSQEENIGDEIVVASSQTRSSQADEDQSEAVTWQPEPEFNLDRQNDAEVIASQELPVAQPVPVKRKRGRPKKSDSQRSATSSQEPASQGLKRRSSVPSMEQHLSTTVVKDTPAPCKKRKSGRRSQDLVEASSSPRRVVAVMPSPPDRHLRQEDDDELGDEEDVPIVTPANQSQDEESVRNRPIAQPKSILSRLRGVLDDCKKMVFGSQEEERAFDDMLFEIRREVHEAGRRGREQ